MKPSPHEQGTDPDLPKLPPPRRRGPWLRRAFAFAACVVSVEALVGEQGLSETLRARKRFDRAAIELAAVHDENVRLRREVDRLQHDLRTIEEVARKELGLIRAGEILVILKDLPAR